MIVWKHGNFYRQIATWQSVYIVSFKIQIEYPVFICYNSQWNRILIQRAEMALNCCVFLRDDTNGFNSNRKFHSRTQKLLILSELFGVSINELLSGKRLTENEYKQAAEENLQQTIKTSSFSLKDNIDFYKR